MPGTTDRYKKKEQYTMAVKKADDVKASHKKNEREKKFSNPFVFFGVVIILVITIVSFILVPAVSFNKGTGKLVFGKYGKQNIEYVVGSYFAQQREALNEQIKPQGTDQIAYQMQAYQVWRGAFERTVIRYAAITEATEAGADVTEAKLDKLMVDYPGFQENGKFSDTRYKAYSLTDQNSIRTNLREETLSNQYYQDIFGVKTSSKETGFVKNMASPERSFKLASFDYNLYPDIEVTAFGTQNADLFRKIKLSRVTATTEKDAKSVLDALQKKSKVFADEVKSHSSDPYAAQGGSMGYQFAYELEKALSSKDDSKKILSLAVGAYSAPIKGAGDSGWSVYRCDEAATAADFSVADTLQSVRGYINRYEKGKIEDYFVKRANEFKAAAAKDFAKACTQFGIKPIDVPAFAINYGDLQFLKPTNQGKQAELASISTDEKILTAMFAAKANDLTDPLITDSSVLVFKVLTDKPAEDSIMNMVGMYFPYIMQQSTNETVANYFLRSPQLKDNFSATFFKYLMPPDQKKN
jgi:peptidyl-prolyl cis-trans isomerase D